MINILRQLAELFWLLDTVKDDAVKQDIWHQIAELIKLGKSV